MGILIKKRTFFLSWSFARMSTSWQYGDVSPARYLFREEDKKKAPVRRMRKENQDVIREAAEQPVKIYKEAPQKAAEKRKEKKKEEEENEKTLNEAARELHALLASVPNDLPLYEEMVVVVEQIPPLPPPPPLPPVHVLSIF